MDPYENGREPADSNEFSHLSLVTAFEVLKNIVHPPRPVPPRHDMLHDVSPRRSQRIARFVRDRPRLPRPAKFGLAALGLAGLVWSLLWKRLKR